MIKIVVFFVMYIFYVIVLHLKSITNALLSKPVRARDTDLDQFIPNSDTTVSSSNTIGRYGHDENTHHIWISVTRQTQAKSSCTRHTVKVNHV